MDSPKPLRRLCSEALLKAICGERSAASAGEATANDTARPSTTE